MLLALIVVVLVDSFCMTADFSEQAAAKLASGLVSTVWHVVDDVVVAPALQVMSQHAQVRPPR